MFLAAKQRLRLVETIILIGLVSSLTGWALFGLHPETPGDPVASVPEASARLNGLTLKGIDSALEQAICLVRSGQAAQCQDPSGNPHWCDIRSREEVLETLKPVFDVLPKIKLTSRFTVNSEIKRLIPGSIPTKAVRDARRTYPCDEWNNQDGRCVAIRFDKLWILLHSPARDHGDIDLFEIFLAEPPCPEDVG